MRESCKICGNWQDRCLCPMRNDHAVWMRQLHIIAAACTKDGVVYAVKQPARHHNVMRMMREQFGLKTGGADVHQGFITSEGDFVGRPEALELARACGQVDKIIGGVLTSEDMW